MAMLVITRGYLKKRTGDVFPRISWFHRFQNGVKKTCPRHSAPLRWRDTWALDCRWWAGFGAPPYGVSAECLSAWVLAEKQKKDQILIKSDSDKISQDITRYVRKGIHKRNADVTRMRLQHFGDRDPNILRKLRCCVAESFWIADIATIWLFVP